MGGRAFNKGDEDDQSKSSAKSAGGGAGRGAGGPGLPPSPEATRTPEPIGFIPEFFVTYEHTSPGSYSTVLVLVLEGEPGSVIEGTVTGPAVDGDGSFSVTVDDSGQATAEVRIFQFGTYTVSIPEHGFTMDVPVGADETTPTPGS